MYEKGAPDIFLKRIEMGENVRVGLCIKFECLLRRFR